jgi:molybdopterin synthase sulfur carrier subunit
MPVVWIPSLLRKFTDGNESVTVAGSTVAEIIDNLDERYPGIKSRLCDGGAIRAGIAIAVDTQVARLGLLQPVSESSEVHFLPAVGGG